MTYVPYTPISNILLDCLRVRLLSSCTLHFKEAVCVRFVIFSIKAESSAKQLVTL
jgi:hypothetical protein